MDDLINIDTNSQPVDPINIDTNQQGSIPVSPSVAESRTNMVTFGNPNIGRNTQDIYNDFINGKEANVRQQVASQMDYARTLNRQKAITDYISKNPDKPLAAQDMDKLLDPNDPINHPINPAIAIEQQYTKAAYGMIDDASFNMTNTFWETANMQSPQTLNLLRSLGEEDTVKDKIIQTAAEDAQEVAKQQSWVGWGVDLAKDFASFGVYNEVKLRGLVDGVNNSSGIFLGSNLEEQRQALYNMEPSKMQATVSKIVKNLQKDNPGQAVEWVEAMKGQTSGSMLTTNLGVAINVALTPELGKLGWNAIKGAREITKTAKTLEDIAKVVKRPDATPADILEAAGDNAGAALEDVSKKLDKINSGGYNPTQATKESLTSNFNLDKDAIQADTGNNARGLKESLLRATEAAKNIVSDILDSTIRVNRLPTQLTKENLEVIQKALLEKHASPDLLDIGSPVLEPTTNTFSYSLKYGTNKGLLFTYEEEALNYAKMKGWDDVTIGREPGRIAGPDNSFSVPSIDKSKYKGEPLPARGVVPANLAPDGTIYVGPKNGQHFEISEKYSKEVRDRLDLKPGKGTWKEVGFVNPDGKFMNREQALDWVNKNEKKVKPSENVPGELDAIDYREQVPESKRSKGTDAVPGTRKIPNGFSVAYVPEAAVKGITGPKFESMAVQNGRLVVRTAGGAEVELSDKAAEGLVPVLYSKNGKTMKVFPTIKAGDASIEQQGLGFYIQTKAHLDETMSVFRDLTTRTKTGEIIPDAISTSSAEGTNSWVNAFIGKFRTSEDTLSKVENEQRKVATYARSRFEEYANAEAQWIKDVAAGIERFDANGDPIPLWKRLPVSVWNKATLKNRRVWKEWEQAVDEGRKAIDPQTGLEGYNFKTVSELEDYYQRNFHRMPSWAEGQAYFANTRLIEYNRILSNIAVFRNKARLGAAQFTMSATNSAGERVSFPTFDGVERKHLPGGTDNIVIMEGPLGSERTVKLSSLVGPSRADIELKLAAGRGKLIEIYDTGAKPLAGSGAIDHTTVRYVYSSDVSSKPLSLNQVTRRGGGHFDYDYNLYIKQAIVEKEELGNALTHRYMGDMTLMPITNRVMGKDIVDKMHEVQRLLAARDETAARAYVSKNLPMPYDEVRGWFFPTKNADGKMIPPRLSLHQEFHIIPRGRTILDVDNSLPNKYGSSWKDNTRSGSLAQQFQVAYTQERDAFNMKTVTADGTRANPIYKWERAKLTDPMVTMNRALNRSINSTFMDDYKILAVENWLREAEPHLRADSDDVRAAPFWHFKNPDYKAGTPTDRLWNLQSNHHKIDQFVGIPNSFDTGVHGLTQHLVDAAFEKYGPEAGRNAAEKAITVLPIWMLSKAKDPVQILRSLAFNAKLGLFNVPQMLVQAQTYATIWALSPKQAIAGTSAAMFHQWLRVARNPDVLENIDRLLNKVRIPGMSAWEPGEFKEAWQTLKRTGFERVAGEYALRDTQLKSDFIGNSFGNFLSAGQFFFKEGEKSTRLGAWYTAFKEFRLANPIGALTEKDIASILDRADLLTTNMSRASASMLHGGVLSLTTQFLSYQLRLAELFFSNRIDNMARLRIMTTYAALYGAPAAVGVTGLPILEDMRKSALDHGYVVGDKWLSSAVMEGIPAWITAMVSGGGDSRKGNWINFGDRLGAQGFNTINSMRADKPWWQILGGAGITTLVNGIAATDGFTKAVLSYARGDNPDQRFKLTSDDFIKPLKEASSFNAAVKFLAALNTGKWIGKNEQYLTDSSPLNAFFMTMTGTNPQDVDDTYLYDQLRKADLELQKKTSQSFIQDFRRGIDAAHEGNPDQTQDYWRNAFATAEMGGLPTDQVMGLVAIANQNYENKINSSIWSWAFKDVPAGEEEKRLDIIQRRKQLEDYRNK